MFDWMEIPSDIEWDDEEAAAILWKEDPEQETYVDVHGQVKKKQSPTAMLEIVKMLNAAMQGRVVEETPPDSELFAEPSERPLE